MVTPFDKVIELFDDIISKTDFWSVMNSLEDKAPDQEAFKYVLEKLEDNKDILNEEKSKGKTTTAVERQYQKTILYISIYEQIREKIVYVSFAEFRTVFESMAENLVNLNVATGKTFFLVLPEQEARSRLKSNFIFTALLINYLKKIGKLSIISGVIFGFLNFYLFLRDSEKVLINEPEIKDLLQEQPFTIESKKQYYFLYCDDGIYSGSQYNQACKSTERIGKLIPFIPYLRETFIDYPEFAEREFRFKYRKFPLATAIIERSACYENSGHVLGYFQHRVPDNVSISNCIPYLGVCEKELNLDFGRFKGILRHINRDRYDDQDHDDLVEYKYLKMTDGRPINEVVMKRYNELLPKEVIEKKKAKIFNDAQQMEEKVKKVKANLKETNSTKFQDLLVKISQIAVEDPEIPKLQKESNEISQEISELYKKFNSIRDKIDTLKRKVDSALPKKTEVTSSILEQFPILNLADYWFYTDKKLIDALSDRTKRKILTAAKEAQTILNSYRQFRIDSSGYGENIANPIESYISKLNHTLIFVLQENISANPGNESPRSKSPKKGSSRR